MIKRLSPSLLASALAIIGFSGCAIGPDYQRPIVALPTHYAVAVDANPIDIRQDWWTYFNDTNLNLLIEDTLKNNADLAAAVARVNEAAGASQEANAGFLPQIDADASTARQHISGKNQTAFNVNPISGTSGSTFINRRATVSTSYEVDVWGRLRRSSENAGALSNASLYARDSVRLSLAAMVCNAYLALRSLDSQLHAAGSTTDSRAETLKLAKIRVAAGLSSPQEQYQAETALATAQVQLSGLRQQRATTESLLGLLTGKTGLQILSTSSLDPLPLPPTPPAGLPSELLAARPDIRQAEATLIAANARIGVAKSAYFPKLSLTGFLGSESRELGDLFRSGAGIWSTGFGLSLPIFDFGRTTARVAQATAQQQQAVAAYQKTIQNAFKEVSDTLVGIRETGEAEIAQTTRRDAARRALDIAQKRYTAGSIAYLELLDNQRTANDAEVAWISAHQNHLTASVDLFKVLGGGWK
jgi:outer membrane protein, multidrug efflux system